MKSRKQPRLQSLPVWFNGVLVAGTFIALVLSEWRRPLRRSLESKLRRNARNIGVAGFGALAIRVVETPLVIPLARLVERRGWGLLNQLGLPGWLKTAMAALLLDYTLYLWHVLTHKVPLLWRFHQVHHVDLDLDASTALRFHFGELALSAPWRAAQVWLIGVSPLALSIWQTAGLVEIMFHHSNLELPIQVERWLSRFVVTPRLHGIHHSTIQEEANSNWSSGLTIWDWLHGTLRLNIPQQAITIGVRSYSDSSELTLPRVLEIPFQEQRPSYPEQSDRQRPEVQKDSNQQLSP
jgi:sterol desaturase/sphingolipid hydroxylase (fatty acid hydroxylase superfamily)